MSRPCNHHSPRRRTSFCLLYASQAKENTTQDLENGSAWAHLAVDPGEIKLAISSERREIRWSVRGAKCTNAANAVSRISQSRSQIATN